MCRTEPWPLANANGIGLIRLKNVSLLHKETSEKCTLVFIVSNSCINTATV